VKYRILAWIAEHIFRGYLVTADEAMEAYELGRQAGAQPLHDLADYVRERYAQHWAGNSPADKTDAWYAEYQRWTAERRASGE
jgi:hypothetical protein